MIEPLFSCQIDGCREEISYHADMLAMHEGVAICQGCYESGDIGLTEDAPDWSDLPAFVPAHEAEITRLRTALAERARALAATRETLSRLVDYADRQTCRHEETHRGGYLWTICDQCGCKWADDQGGMPEFKLPIEIIRARALAQGEG